MKRCRSTSPSHGVDFYEPYEMDDGRIIYGAAAANHRAKLIGDWNIVFEKAYQAGLQNGLQITFQKMMQTSRAIRS